MGGIARREEITNPACPLGLILQAPTPSSTPIKFPLANTASSPFVYPLINCPSTNACRRSRLRLCVLSGSLNDPDGGDRNDGGHQASTIGVTQKPDLEFPRLPFRFETGIGLFAKRTPRPFPPPSSSCEGMGVEVDDVADGVVTSAAADSSSDRRWESLDCPVTKPCRHTCTAGTGDRSCATTPPRRIACGVVETSWYSRRTSISNFIHRCARAIALSFWRARKDRKSVV